MSNANFKIYGGTDANIIETSGPLEMTGYNGGPLGIHLSTDGKLGIGTALPTINPLLSGPLHIVKGTTNMVFGNPAIPLNVLNTSISMGGFTVKYACPTIANNGFIDIIDSNTAGFGIVQSNYSGTQEIFAKFGWTTTRIVNMIINNENVSSTNVAGKLCIFNNTSSVRIQNNNLGNSIKLNLELHMSTITA